MAGTGFAGDKLQTRRGGSPAGPGSGGRVEADPPRFGEQYQRRIATEALVEYPDDGSPDR